MPLQLIDSSSPGWTSFTVQIVCDKVFGDHLARQLWMGSSVSEEIWYWNPVAYANSLWNTCVIYSLECDA